MVIAVLLYYFDAAGSAWFTIIGVAWLISAAQVASEEIDKRSSYFHLFGWGLPAVQSLVFVVLRHVDADELTGLCSVGNSNPSALFWFVLIPKGAYLASAVAVFLIGFCKLYCDREKIRTAFGGLGHMEKLMLRLGTFVLLYVGGALGALGTLIYQYIVLRRWEPALKSCDVAPPAPAAPIPEIFHLKLFLLFAPGILAGAVWLLSRKTWYRWFETFSALLTCGKFQNFKRPANFSNFSNHSNVQQQAYVPVSQQIPSIPQQIPSQRNYYNQYPSSANSSSIVRHSNPMYSGRISQTIL